MTLEQRLDLALTRNARLIVRLRRCAALLHRTVPGHDLLKPWPECPHEDCQHTIKVIEDMTPW